MDNNQNNRRLKLAETFYGMYLHEKDVRKKFLKLVDESTEDFSGQGWEPYRRLLDEARQDSPIVHKAANMVLTYHPEEVVNQIQFNLE